MNAMIIQIISRCSSAFFILLVLLGFSGTSAQSTHGTGTLLTIDASAPVAAPKSGYLEMGRGNADTSPSGRVLSVNSRYLMMEGNPWLPVMGEFHYSRYPERYWEEEILKMKAGGIQIIATYIFWIHHEEIEGQFDWTGQRDLRKFIELCAKHGLYVYPRIGPWAHGEVRNGGFPDWLLTKGPTRVSDFTYLSYVHKYYNEIGKQLKGLLWKDGGPIIGIQLENEYANRAPNGGAAHISKLKSMAIEAGLNVPLYTVTGWDNTIYPLREVIPVFGGYPDEPWSGSTGELDPDPQGVYQFHVTTPVGTAGILQGISVASAEVQLSHYPKFTCELGGGMEVTYHRRVVIQADDVVPMALTALGSGVNLPGYYMFHGGANPEGKLTTLHESQATGYPNDVPVVSYDFQAPLGEFGQMNESFRKLKVIHQFIQDFGTDLAPMTAVLPDAVPSGPRDTSTLRLAARTQGDHGFLFFNNYLRHYPLPEHKDVQVIMKLPSETITVPRKPVDVPSQSCFIWPVNLDLSGALLKYATAQPLAKIDNGKTVYYFFISSPGIVPEFVFAEHTISSFNSKTAAVSRQDERVYVSGIVPSAKVVMEFQTQTGKAVRIVVLSQEQAYNSWKIPMNSQERLFITPADLFVEGETIHLRSRNPKDFSISMFPDIGEKLTSNVRLLKTGKDGAFIHYMSPVKSRKVPVTIQKIREAAPSSPVPMGRPVDWRPGPVASAPDDSVFEKAGIWRVTTTREMLSDLSDIFLDINYVGDVGRLYEGTHMFDDNFFNGTIWEVGLKRFEPNMLVKGIVLKILPLRKDAPIYMPKISWPKFNGKSEIAEVIGVTVSPEYEVRLTFQRK